MVGSVDRGPGGMAGTHHVGEAPRATGGAQALAHGLPDERYPPSPELMPANKTGRVALIPAELFDRLHAALSEVDGSALKELPGGGMDLSGWVVRRARRADQPVPHSNRFSQEGR